MTTLIKTTAVVSSFLLAVSLWGYASAFVTGKTSAGDILLWSDQTIINATILTMAVMIFSRRLELLWIPILLSAGEAVYDNRILISGLHSILIRSDTYASLLGRHGTGQVNPQYAMLTAYLAAFLCLAGTVLIPKRRSFDRVLVLVHAVSVFATFTLFHAFLMAGIHHDTENEGRALKAALLSDNFETQCRVLDLECSIVWDSDAKEGNLGGVDPLAVRTVADIARQGIDVARPFVWDGAVDDEASRTTFFIIGVGKDPQGFRIARSRGPYEEATEFEGLRYSAQAAAAHATWFAMLCGLVWVHRRHSRTKVRRVFSEDSFR
jgi:hypothetical protein